MNHDMVEVCPALGQCTQQMIGLQIPDVRGRVDGAVGEAYHGTKVRPQVHLPSVDDHDLHILEAGVLEVESPGPEGYLLIIPTLALSRHPSN